MTTKKGAPYVFRLSSHFEESKEEFNLLIDAQGTNWLYLGVTPTLFEETAFHFFVQCNNNSADELACTCPAFSLLLWNRIMIMTINCYTFYLSALIFSRYSQAVMSKNSFHRFMKGINITEVKDWHGKRFEIQENSDDIEKHCRNRHTKPTELIICDE